MCTIPHLGVHSDHAHERFLHVSAHALAPVAGAPVELARVHVVLQSANDRVRLFLDVLLEQRLVQRDVRLPSFLSDTEKCLF